MTDATTKYARAVKDLIAHTIDMLPAELQHEYLDVLENDGRIVVVSRTGANAHEIGISIESPDGKIQPLVLRDVTGTTPVWRH